MYGIQSKSLGSAKMKQLSAHYEARGLNRVTGEGLIAGPNYPELHREMRYVTLRQMGCESVLLHRSQNPLINDAKGSRNTPVILK